MKARRRWLGYGVCAAMLALAAPLGTQTPGPRPITEQDILGFHWIADPQITPDGSRIAYTLVRVDDKGERYEASLWMVGTDGSAPPHRLTAGPHDGAPRWSPDGRQLAFVRSSGENPPQLYLLSLDGGEPRKLTDLPKGTGRASWSPDGRHIAFVSSTLPEDSAAKTDSSKKKKSDVHVITNAEYRSNGEGWNDFTRHDHVWTIDLDSLRDSPLKAKQLTAGKYDEEDLVWSRDGKRIFFATERVDEPYYLAPDQDLYAVPATGGAIEKVVDIDGPVVGAVPSPDGQAFAFSGWVNPKQRQSYTQDHLFVARGGNAQQITKGGDADVGSQLTGDQHPPRGGAGSSPILWSLDGRSFLIAMSERGRSNLVRVDAASGKSEPVTTGDHDIVAYTATPDLAKIALTITDGTHLTDLYLLDPASRALTQLTHVNDSLWSGLKLSKPERITYKSFDGRQIEAWVVKPPDFSPGNKYPLILNIHGGPHAAYGDTFDHEFQVMAARGYVVLAPNPRGSTTYGQEFGNIIQYRYPGDDYKDLMVGVDTLIKRGYIDPKRLGVTGGSGGGLLTNWTVTQTNRFAAAVSQRSIADWAAWWYTADFTLFSPAWFRAPPFKDPQDYARRSPITYIERVTTPLMLIDGEEDSRTPMEAGGMTMFRALKALHKPTALVIFPGETHELSRSGGPQHRVERLQHIIGWFDKYMQGKSGMIYDVQ